MNGIGALTTMVYAERGANSCSIPGCDAPYYGATFCKKHHQWHWKRGLLPKTPELSIYEKLLAYSYVDANGCWIWKKGLSTSGYALIALPAGESAYASRISYTVFVEPIADELEACHTCDTPACICPWHLFPGTHLENMQDSVRKGRAKQWLPPSSHEAPRSIFSAELVAEIRDPAADVHAIAARIGCHIETVRRCRRRDTYRDV